MPTVLFLKGLRFFFFSNDHEPIHVHVETRSGSQSAKIELVPEIKVVMVKGFSRNDMKKILKLCREAQEDLIDSWRDYFES